MAAAPEVIYDAIAEILVRLPPDEPEHLFRAALVCKLWLRILCNAAFLRRYRAYHGAPPLIGFILKHGLDPVPHFSSTTAAPVFPFPNPGPYCTWALDCRHGRVLMVENWCWDFVVRNPVSGDRRCVPEPEPGAGWLSRVLSGAVLCAADGCDHLDCHDDGPFRLVLVGSDIDRADLVYACVYSSATCTWSTQASLDNCRYYDALCRRGVVVNDEIYFTFSKDEAILKYDWGNNRLSTVKTPVVPSKYYGPAAVMTMADGSLGLAGVKDYSLYVSSRKVNSEGDAEWLLCKVINLETVMPTANLGDETYVVGFADGVDVIFLNTSAGLFTIQLKSGRVRMVHGLKFNFSVLPYMSFYTPGTMPTLASYCPTISL